MTDKNISWAKKTRIRGTWRKKDGSIIEISQMQDDYLNNAIKFLEKKAKLKTHELQSKLGQFKNSQKISEHPAYFFGAIYDELLEEQNKRNKSRDITQSLVVDYDELSDIKQK